MKRIAFGSMRLWMMVGICTLCLQVFSQGSTRKVTFTNFTLQENVNQYGKGITGLEMEFDVFFNWEETEFFKQNFNMNFRLEQAGIKLLESSKMERTPSTIMTRMETVGGKPGMAARDQKVFIPYLEIPLESGPQKADIIFSLSNGDGSYTDCFKTTLQWQHKKVIRHSLNEQVFNFQIPSIDYLAKEFATNKPGMTLITDVTYQYGPEECIESHYQIACLIKSGGKQVYDSRKASSTSDNTKSIPVELKEGKPCARTHFFIKYYDLQMDGPAEAEIIFLLMGAEGGPKEVFSKTMTLDIPVKYDFEKQEFTLSQLEVAPAVLHGVQGISVNYACGFKYTTLLRNPDKGNFYFYLALFDANGKLVIDPSRAPTGYVSTAHLMDGQLPSPTNTEGRGRLFIPYYLLTTPAGNQNLKYALMVSDVNLGTKFPVVGQGSVTIQKPEERQYWVALEQLEMIDANYDAEFLSINGHLPELRYLFCVGEDSFYESDYTKNSLIAVPGSAMLRCSAGDELQMKLYDVDSGFFNASDLQGKWKLDYVTQGDHFNVEVKEQGQVSALKIKVDRRN